MSGSEKSLPVARPKGSMCIACAHAARDCSALPFETMPTLSTAPDGGRVVRCQDFAPKPAHSKALFDTSDLEGPALDWAVGAALGKALRVLPSEYGTGPRVFIDEGLQQIRWKPSSATAQAAELIQGHLVELLAPTDDSPLWAARIRAAGVIQFGPTPFIAAARVVVAVLIGEAVEVPAELFGRGA